MGVRRAKQIVKELQARLDEYSKGKNDTFVRFSVVKDQLLI